MSRRAFVAAAAVVTVLVAGVLSGFASSHPDGLESIASASGFAADARESVTAGSPLADYAVAGWGGSRMSGAAAGIAGCLLVFLTVTGITRQRGSETQS